MWEHELIRRKEVKEFLKEHRERMDQISTQSAALEICDAFDFKVSVEVSVLGSDDSFKVQWP